EGERRRDLAAAAAPRRAVEDRQEQFGLAVAGESGEADDLALMGDELGSVGLPLGPGADADRRGRVAPCCPLCGSARLLAGSAHRGDELVAIEGGGLVGGDNLAVAHDDDAIGMVEDFAEEMRNEDAAGTAGDDAANEGE